MMSKKVFITRSLLTSSPLQQLREHYEFYGQSLIDIQPIDFSVEQPTEWYFFYSSNGIKYFHPKDIGQDSKYAVFGQGSAKTFKSIYGRSPDFIGDGTAQTALDYFSKVKAQITFVKGKNSLSSVDRFLKGENIVELTVYDNSPNFNTEIPDADIYIITSPMNAQVYMSKPCCRFNSKVIAIGNTTNQALMDKGYLMAAIPDTPSEESIVKLLNQMKDE